MPKVMQNSLGRTSGLYTIYNIVWKTNCIKKPERKLPNSSYSHNTPTTHGTFVKDSLQMHFKVAVKNVMLLIQAAQVIPSQHSYMM